jgi:hypothetical protein
MRREWAERVDRLGRHGLRVIACAMKMGTGAEAAPYERLTFAGLIALEDPARANVPAAIADCRKAGGSRSGLPENVGRAPEPQVGRCGSRHGSRPRITRRLT